MTIEEQAKEMVNKVYQPLGYLKCHVSSDEMWEYAKARCIEFQEQLSNKLNEGSIAWLETNELKDAIRNL